MRGNMCCVHTELGQLVSDFACLPVFPAQFYQGFSRVMASPARSGGFQNVAGQVGSGQEVSEMSRVESGPVNKF